MAVHTQNQNKQKNDTTTIARQEGRSMNIEHLVKMANQIGNFFSTMPDQQQARTDLAAHIKRFWEPRMRRALLEHVEQQGGAGLSDIVLEAIRAHSTELVA